MGDRPRISEATADWILDRIARGNTSDVDLSDSDDDTVVDSAVFLPIDDGPCSDSSTDEEFLTTTDRKGRQPLWKAGHRLFCGWKPCYTNPPRKHRWQRRILVPTDKTNTTASSWSQSKNTGTPAAASWCSKCSSVYAARLQHENQVILHKMSNVLLYYKGKTMFRESSHDQLRKLKDCEHDLQVCFCMKSD